MYKCIVCYQLWDEINFHDVSGICLACFNSRQTNEYNQDLDSFSQTIDRKK